MKMPIKLSKAIRTMMTRLIRPNSTCDTCSYSRQQRAAADCWCDNRRGEEEAAAVEEFCVTGGRSDATFIATERV